jgi:hypothetical protein
VDLSDDLKLQFEAVSHFPEKEKRVVTARKKEIHSTKNQPASPKKKRA